MAPPLRPLLDRVDTTLPFPRIPSSEISSSTNSSPRQSSPFSEERSSATSLQASPDSIHGKQLALEPQFENLALPESILPERLHKHNASDATITAPKQGLLRKHSQRVNKAFAPRRPSNQLPNKEPTLGAAISRRRNNSIQESAHAQINVPVIGADGSVQPTQLLRAKTSYQGLDFSDDHTTAEEEEKFLGVVLPPTPMMKLSKKLKKRRAVTLVIDRTTATVSYSPKNPSKPILIDDICSIILGPKAQEWYREYTVNVAPSEHDRWLAIHYADSRGKGRDSHKVLHLLAPSHESAHVWQQSLTFLNRYRETIMATLPDQKPPQLESLWDNLLEGWRAQSADLKMIKGFCSENHLNSSPESIQGLFQQIDGNHDGRIDFSEFWKFLKLLLRRDDIEGIYRRACSDAQTGMTIVDFTNFLTVQQGWSNEASQTRGRSIFEAMTVPTQDYHDGIGTLTVTPSSIMKQEVFDRFLRSKDNPILNELPSEYELTRPLNEYYIASSHNTYLSGKQILSSGSHAAYVKALVDGCRCIEIDCWDGTEKTRPGFPEVRHRDWTKAIDFSDVISTVSDHAFRSSPYPLIISLEVHCKHKGQDIMADEIRRVFGEQLLTSKLIEDSDELPSPEQLKQRVLIKVKPGILENSVISAPDSPVVKPQSCDGESSPRSPGIISQPNAPRSKITRKLGELAIYTKGVKFGHWGNAELNSFGHVVSLSESSFEKSRSTSNGVSSLPLLEAHNRKHLMRTYPKGFRVESSNFSPMEHWRRGVQMVALNCQTFDDGQQLNRAMFSGGTDRLGYILKPRELRGPPLHPVLPTGETPKTVKTLRFSIEIISAQRLTRATTSTRAISPYVEVDVLMADEENDQLTCAGQVEAGRKRFGFRTAPIKGNGLNPIWDKKLEFTVQTKFDELCFLRFTIRSDAQDIPHGMCVVKLSSLATGYRYMPMYDISGNPYIFSTLLCKIGKEPVMIGALEPPTTKPGKLSRSSSTRKKMTPTPPSISRVSSSASRH